MHIDQNKRNEIGKGGAVNVYKYYPKKHSYDREFPYAPLHYYHPGVTVRQHQQRLRQHQNWKPRKVAYQEKKEMPDK